MSDFPMPPPGWEDVPDGLDDLTDQERDLLGHLTVLTVQRSLQRSRPWARDYDRVSVALESIAEDGMVKLVGNATDVWVIVAGRPIVHAARDWLRWTAAVAERGAARN
jgi:hypothetical protein